MKLLSLFFIFLFTLNCSINKVSNTHGFRLIENKYNKVILNKSNKNDVRKLIGPPSSISKFQDIWFYIEREKTNQSIFKIGKKKISSNNIILIEFNKLGIVSNKKLLNLNDLNDIDIEEAKTRKKFSQDNRLYTILSTLRDKINAPTRNK